MNTQRGFTLIELLVVISIISLLSTVVISQTREARLRAENAQITQDTRQWMTALDRYSLDNGKYWGDESIAGNESSILRLICLGLPCSGQDLSENTSFRDAMVKYIPYINPNRKPIKYSDKTRTSFILYQNDDYINEVTLYYFLNGDSNCLPGTEKQYDPSNKSTRCYRYYIYKTWTE